MDERAMVERLPDEGKIWYNGTFVDWKDAKVHVLSYELHYGSGVFEGFGAMQPRKVRSFSG